MKKRIFSWKTAFTVMGLSISTLTTAYQARHEDYRETTKLETEINIAKTSEQSTDDLVRSFLKSRITAYGLRDAALADLTLREVTHSLSASHYHFDQHFDGILVRRGEIAVSVDNNTSTIFQAYNNYLPVTAIQNLAGPATPSTLSLNKILDAAWEDLHVQGELQEEPRVQKYIRVADNGVATLVYVTYLNVSEPLGAWEHEIDATTGKVLSRKDIRIQRKSSSSAISPIFYKEPAINRTKAFQKFEARQKSKKAALKTHAEPRDGKGMVFDPDPRTELEDETLEDDSPSFAFTAAYVERPLRDLVFDGNAFKLEGPWVKIVDFDYPDTLPSTSTTGIWDSERGNSAFNDAMSYFHIDQSQRYIQSLGFTNSKSIQAGPIEVDTDGVGGDDNSYYLPGDNKLAFGHGCVDDNEDADVILHEYGHAIHMAINENWSGGDTGAMGEGFGDYWAGSYSISLEKGKRFFPNAVYNWDGHGSGSCWDGRNLDAVEMRYNHSVNYQAHAPVGARSSDELWSAPLFQSLLAVLQNGGKREEMDRIVLEAQFGLGARLKMRDLAHATIAASKRLYPNGPYADTLTQKFKAQKIILP
jgi:hypothetical protein